MPELFLICPECNEHSATISLRLSDRCFTCQECGEEFEIAELREYLHTLQSRISMWANILAWVERMPSANPKANEET